MILFKVPYVPVIDNCIIVMRISIVFFVSVLMHTLFMSHDMSIIYVTLVHNVINAGVYFVPTLMVLILYSYFFSAVRPVYSFISFFIITWIMVLLVSVFVNEELSLLNNIYLLINTTLVLLLFFLYFDWHKKNTDPESLRIKLHTLQERMRPHFLFNTLSSVLYLIHKDVNAAEKMLLNLSDLLREIIRSDGLSSTVGEELDLCRKYLEIEKIRLGERLSYDFDVEDGLLKLPIPRLSLQPLVENAILHSVQYSSAVSNIKLWVIKDDGVVRVIITNPLYLGKKIVKNSNKTALVNLEQRLSLYYNRKVLIKVEKVNNEFKLSFNIPNSGEISG